MGTLPTLLSDIEELDDGAGADMRGYRNDASLGVLCRQFGKHGTVPSHYELNLIGFVP